jgi:hypothetical protein
MNTVRLHKIRAGRYATTPDPEVGTYVTTSHHDGYYKKTSWSISRYEISSVDGSLELIEFGYYQPTLAYSRSVIAQLLNEQETRS